MDYNETVTIPHKTITHHGFPCDGNAGRNMYGRLQATDDFTQRCLSFSQLKKPLSTQSIPANSRPSVVGFVGDQGGPAALPPAAAAAASGLPALPAAAAAGSVGASTEATVRGATSPPGGTAVAFAAAAADPAAAEATEAAMNKKMSSETGDASIALVGVHSEYPR